ncbi:PaaI family thioesterase [Chitinophaga pendula]|uniref:PaaI family thioesterase n=1 Tax=Chitinophaga TaxID=79328 RepID=UPI000BAE9A64|nr:MULTISPECIES: PaaI family thioesterase [Chitinophaga]ASZ13014.1 thioesterase [Chitinophaga sp. MD30]UCJ09356.1 PaaI family thioesterase [Chitinophaga pendula]
MERLQHLQTFIGKVFTDSPSPFMRWLHPTVLSATEGQLEFQYTVRHEMTNPAGTLHGGVTAAIIDDIMGATLYTLNSETDHFYSTLNNVIDYFASAREGDTIIAVTSIVKKGKQIINLQCEVWNNNKEKLLAKGYSNVIKTPLR